MAGRSVFAPLRSGELNRRVSLSRIALADDGKGAQVETPTIFATVWAEAISQNGRESMLAGALQGISSWRIRIRWRADVTTDDQVTLDGKLLNIRSVEDPTGRREQLVIFADSASVQQ